MTWNVTDGQGGGSYTGGNGIGVADGTITNTGTLFQPGVTSGSGHGIVLQGSDVINPGTASPVSGAGSYLGGVNINLTDPLGDGVAGYLNLGGGEATYAISVQAFAGSMNFNGASISGSTGVAIGGSVYGQGGAATGASVTNTGGAAVWEAGYGTQQGGLVRVQGGGAGGSGIGGNLQLGGGDGGTFGGIILNPQPGTVDPHVLGELWQNSHVLTVSQG